METGQAIGQDALDSLLAHGRFENRFEVYHVADISEDEVADLWIVREFVGAVLVLALASTDVDGRAVVVRMASTLRCNHQGPAIAAVDESSKDVDVCALRVLVAVPLGVLGEPVLAVVVLLLCDQRVVVIWYQYPF